MSDPPVYSHTLPARSIRLLTIEPGEPGSPLQCTLQEACLDSDIIAYNALSYCWGQNDSPAEILCNSQPFLVTPNLHAVLLQYRRRAISTPLWVDAICINQCDIPERTAQVRIMQKIYSQAACVVVWLGEAEETDEMALELLKMMNAPWATVTDDRGRKVPLFTGSNAEDHDAYVAQQVPQRYFDALAAFLMRPWFSRIWIVQELLAARETAVWCGSETLNEKFPILEASARLSIFTNCSVKTQLATTDMGDLEAETSGRAKLSCAGRLWVVKMAAEMKMDGIKHLLCFTHCFDATDPRDKIFALVGLASDIDEDFIDYSKSYQEIIEDLSRRFLDGRIETDGCFTLDVWSCISRSEDDELTGPSWVIDWSKLHHSLYGPLMASYPSKDSLIKRRPEIRFAKEADKEVLEVRSVIFDQITQIVPSPLCMRQVVPQSDLVAGKYLPDFARWHTEACQSALSTIEESNPIYEATGESLYEAFWRTLCCNRAGSREDGTPENDNSYESWCQLIQIQQQRLQHETLFSRYMGMLKWGLWIGSTASISALTYLCRRNRLLVVAIPLALPYTIRFFDIACKSGMETIRYNLIVKCIKDSHQVQIDQREFESTFSNISQGRQFGITKLGLMGWFPVLAKPGDFIGLFGGCRIPYALRAVEGGMKLIGDAYVHGVMNGEAEGRHEGMMIRIV